MPPPENHPPEAPVAPGVAPVILPKKKPKGREDMCLMHDLFLHVCFAYDPIRCVRLALRVILGFEPRLIEVSQQAEVKSLEGRSVIMDFLAEDD